MKRIDTPTAAPDLHGSGKAGFRDGSVPGVEPTDLNADWFNNVQEEIMGVIEGAGLTADGDDLGQLLAAIKRFSPAAVRCEFVGTAVASGSKFTPTIIAGDTPLFSVNVTDVVLPSYGLYLVSVHALITCASTANPATFGVKSRIGGGTIVNGEVPVLGTRWSATNTDKIAISAAQVVNIASGSKLFDVRFDDNGLGATGTIATSDAYAHIVRLRAYD